MPKWKNFAKFGHNGLDRPISSICFCFGTSGKASVNIFTILFCSSIEGGVLPVEDQQKAWLFIGTLKDCDTALSFLKKWAKPGLFSSFHTNIIILQQIYVKKCSSSIQCRDSNQQLSEHKSCPITTRPGSRPYTALS